MLYDIMPLILTKQERRQMAIKKALEPLPRMMMLWIFIAALVLFCVGFHNMDNGQNLRYINGLMHDDNITFSEFSSQGVEFTAAECYISGFNQALLGGFMLMMIALMHVIEFYNRKT
jgi:hypothetical protein